VSAQPHEVRAAPSFFEDLDRQLRSERGPNGEPSTTDFQTFELLNIVERFRTGFDDLPELLPDRSDYRVLIATGDLIRAYTVVGQLRPDGAVELLTLELDLGMDSD
jgi:hypothetical protein